MALLPIHDYFIFNGKLTSIDAFVPSENEGGIYEVLRVVNGVPLFLEDHLQRFFQSADIAGKTIQFSFAEIQSFLNTLIKQNKVGEGNILISCKTNLKAFFIVHNYPTAQQYNKGVSCGILHAERVNPNAKVFQTSVRQQANDLIAENKFFEVLLVDQNKRITEGSRTNVFFIKGDTIITPKPDNVLLGITRKKTIQCAKQLGYLVTEKDVDLRSLKEFDAVFLTGTSPKILPINSVAEVELDAENLILRKLMDQFNLEIMNYIKNAQL